MTTHLQRLTTSLRMACLLCLSLLALAAVVSGQQPTYADVPALLRELKSKDAPVRVEAARKLARMGVEAEAAVPVLAELLRNEHKGVRFMAALALAEYGPGARAAVPALSEALGDKDRSVQTQAALALGLIGRDSKDAIPSLIKRLSDPDAYVRRHVVDALGVIEPEASSVLAVIIDTLKDEDDHVRASAAQVLEKLGPAAKAATPALADHLKDRDSPARHWAIIVLGAIGPGAKETVPALLKSLRDREAAIRLAAAVALLKIAPESEAQITPALRDKAKAWIKDEKAFAEGGVGFNTWGGLDFRKGDFAAALANFDEAIKADPKNPTYHLNRGDTLEALGKLDAAEASYREALRLAPDEPHLLNHLGYFLVEQDKGIAEALRLIERAVAAQPANPFFLDSLGRAHFKLGHLDEAERHLAECVRRDGAVVLCHEHLGDLYDRRGDAGRAREAWSKALSLSGGAKAIARLKGKLGAPSGDAEGICPR